MATGLLSFLSHDSSNTLYANTICVHAEGIAGEPTLTDWQTIVDECSTWLKDAYRQCLPDLLTVDDLRFTGVGTDHGKQAFHHVGQVGLNASVDGKLPKELAVIMALKTNQATRSGRGHIAIPSIRQSSVIDANGNWNTGAGIWTSLNAFGAALLAGHDYVHDLISIHLSTRVWSRKNVESYDVTSYTLRTAPRWVESRQTAP